MVKHIILWKLKEEFTDEEKAKIKQEAKSGLEGLKGQIEGLNDIKVNINGLETSNCDMMLDSTLESFEALKAYAVHPKHVNIADTYVRPFTADRVCLDFEE